MRRGFLLSQSDREKRAQRAQSLTPSSMVPPVPASASQTIVKIPSDKAAPLTHAPPYCESMLDRKHAFIQYNFRDPNMPAHLVPGVLFYDGMEEEILSSLGLDRIPVPFSPPSPPVYKIVPVEGFGLSMVATTDIARGQTIAIERPLLLYPQTVPCSSVAELLAYYEWMVSELRPENREAVWAHTNVKGPEWFSHLKGIMDTNGLGIGDLPGYPAMYAVLARDISRVNHSCSPNACHTFDIASLTVVLRALAPIRAGEQVTITYTELTAPRAERREELSRRYKFVCMCQACNRNEADISFSDVNRRLLNLRALEVADDEEAFEKWLADGAPLQSAAMLIKSPEDVLNAVDNMNGFMRAAHIYATMEHEGFFLHGLWEPVLARLVKGHSVLQNEDEVRRYALLAASLKRAETGLDGGWTAVVENPKQTDWWGKRQN